MIRRLSLNGFKNFVDAELHLGPFSVLVGANASGKSNVRDALRFLHGVGRGYTLAETFGEKYMEGALQWRGLRGTLGEMAFRGGDFFWIEVELDISAFIAEPEMFPKPMTYRIGISIDRSEGVAHVEGEKLIHNGTLLFESEPQSKQVTANVGSDFLMFGVPEEFASTRPALTQIDDIIDVKGDLSAQKVHHAVQGTTKALQAMRFLDLHPSAMRQPSMPGQTTLSDRGENLSSVLQAICEDDARKATLVEWMQMLTPMDAVDLRFPSDLSGKTLAVIVEPNDHETTLYSASDGTLRFLAIAAVLLGPSPERFYFFEEIENGIHPARLDLLVQLIEQTVADGPAQVAATTHSPTLLRLLGPEAREHASLVFRREGESKGHIRRIVDLPEARRILETQDLARLFESGWMETSMAFSQDDAPETNASGNGAGERA